MESNEMHLESMKKAVKNIHIADHMLYVTYPVIKDKRLLLKVLDQVYDAVVYIINAVLQQDYILKRIKLYSDPKANFQTFMEKSSKNYNITSDEVKEVAELVSLYESHKKSPMEFSRRDKIVIMSNSLKTSIIDSEKLKKYLNLSKNLAGKAKLGMAV